MRPVVLYFDGLCEPTNPGGWACWAWVALARDGAEVGHDLGCLGRGPNATNNRAEYAALILGLTWLAEQRHAGVVVRGDSQLVIRQIMGVYACRSTALIPLLAEAQRRMQAAQISRLEWVPREKNVRADGYSRRAYHEARHAPVG